LACALLNARFYFSNTTKLRTDGACRGTEVALSRETPSRQSTIIAKTQIWRRGHSHLIAGPFSAITLPRQVSKLPMSFYEKTQEFGHSSIIGISSGFHRRNSTTIVQFRAYLAFRFSISIYRRPY